LPIDSTSLPNTHHKTINGENTSNVRINIILKKFITIIVTKARLKTNIFKNIIIRDNSLFFTFDNVSWSPIISRSSFSVGILSLLTPQKGFSLSADIEKAPSVAILLKRNIPNQKYINGHDKSSDEGSKSFKPNFFGSSTEFSVLVISLSVHIASIRLRFVLFVAC
jgi:hypothetical protein